ncbi:hypothetical protein J6590_008717, partial [Homalodisca vitripennis]
MDGKTHDLFSVASALAAEASWTRARAGSLTLEQTDIYLHIKDTVKEHKCNSVTGRSRVEREAQVHLSIQDDSGRINVSRPAWVSGSSVSQYVLLHVVRRLHGLSLEIAKPS